jgi:hypothetical protein
MGSKELIRRKVALYIVLTISALVLCLNLFLQTERPMALTTINIPSRISVVNLNAKDSVTAHFQIINTGLKTLKISNIDLDCSCTGYYLDHHMLMPGDTGLLSVTVTHSGVSFTRSIIVHCNSAESPVGLKVVGLINSAL